MNILYKNIITDEIVEAVMYKGSSTHKSAIKRWLESGEYYQPQIVTCDFSSFELDGIEVSPLEYVVKYGDGGTDVYSSNNFESTFIKI